MSSRIDVIGDRFGRLVVVADTDPIQEPSGRTKRQLIARCDCGNEIIARFSHLRHGYTKSCGCLQIERTREANQQRAGQQRAGQQHANGGHGDVGTPEYKAWAGMIYRCENPNYKGFKNYGGRGIRVCARWRESYIAFLADMGRRPSSDRSIDRINCDGDYEPGNCRWATVDEQQKNRRPRSR